MKFYNKYKPALEAAGYQVDEYGCVWDAAGNQAAVEDNYGNVQCKDPNVTDICRVAEVELSKPKSAPKKAAKKVETDVVTESVTEEVSLGS
jgi:hypothetical protein